ncbi:MAG: dihydropyrimidinase [Clostridiales bacterium]|nr:dihydropyrimidinase [Clostridiales bacterium]
MDLLIKNGTVVNGSESYKADIAVENGKIIQIGNDIAPTDNAKIVDAAGKFVLPGAIDAHTHLAMPFGGTISSDDYFAGTRAAACGGTTTVFDFVLQDFGETMVDAVKRRDAMCAPVAAVDYSYHVAVKDVSGDLLDSIEEAVKFGVPSFKVFMVYDFGVTDGVFYKVLKKAKECGALIGVHAENNEMVNTLTAQYLSEGKTSAWYHYMSRPEFVEAEADIRAIQWAKALDAPLYIVHLANKDGVKAVTEAKDEGYKIYAETCPQYLEFTCDVYKREDGRNFVCSPPMKGEESRQALWEAIKRGDIDTIATDHCPFQSYEKNWGKDDFTKIPNGCAGIENMYPYMLSAATEGKITYEKAVKVCSENPAKIFGCRDKGSIAIGKDADIVIYDPKAEFTITNDKMHSDCDHTIWEGIKLKGYPEQTYSRGRLVYDKGEFVGNAGWGKFVKCKL